jgi:hypothetical protein
MRGLKEIFGKIEASDYGRYCPFAKLRALTVMFNGKGLGPTPDIGMIDHSLASLAFTLMEFKARIML